MAEDMNKILFTNLIMMLGSTAMQQMGKLVNPMTGKTEVSLEGAQASIDLIAMLQAKTAGNLDDEEAKTIKDIVSSLQMNYVETSKEDHSKSEEKPAEKSEDDSKEEKPAEKSEDDSKEVKEASNSADSKEPKFHKSYEDEKGKK